MSYYTIGDIAERCKIGCNDFCWTISVYKSGVKANFDVCQNDMKPGYYSVCVCVCVCVCVYTYIYDLTRK